MKLSYLVTKILKCKKRKVTLKQVRQEIIRLRRNMNQLDKKLVRYNRALAVLERTHKNFTDLNYKLSEETQK